MILTLFLVLIVLSLGGGWGYGYRGGYAWGAPVGGLGVLLLIVLIVLLCTHVVAW